MSALVRLPALPLVLGALALSATPATAQSDPGLPGVPPGILQVVPDGSLLSVSPGGTAAAGSAETVVPLNTAARWVGGSDLLVMPGASRAEFVSDDGSLALTTRSSSTSPGNAVATLWTGQPGWVELPPPAGLNPSPSADWPGEGLSASGEVVVGSYRDGEAGVYRAWSWSFFQGSGLLPLSDLMSRSGAFAVSADGAVIGGTMGWLSPFTGDPLFRPCLWRADGSIEHLLPMGVTTSGLPASFEASVVDLDANGSAAVGVSADRMPFLWREGQGLTWLPGTPDGSLTPAQMIPLAVGEDGSFVIGEAAQVGERWVWTPHAGTQDLRAVLEGLGVAPSGSFGGDALPKDASLDGTVLVGSISTGVLESDGLVWQIPSLATLGSWTDLGGGFAAPFNPTPQLTGSGPQFAGAHTEVTLQPYPHSGLAYLVVGLSDLSAPFKGGLLVPHPDLLITQLYFGGTSWTLDFDWPAGVPPGASIWYQAWLTSNESLTGFVASNGLRSTTG